MSFTAPAGELLDGYEALRAQALGEFPRLSPRGLAVLLRGGLVSWMRACPPASRPRPPANIVVGPQSRSLAGGSPELVRLLAQMALTSRRRCLA